MANYIRVDELKEKLASCKVCFEHFDEVSHVPRRMPCCFASICHTCLEQIFVRHGSPLSCPLCRAKHAISSVAYFRKDNHILDILDIAKVARGGKTPCTDCPDKNMAVRFCEDCSEYFCPACLAAHGRAKQTRQHLTSSLDDNTPRPLNTPRPRRQLGHVSILEGLSQTRGSFNMLLNQYKEKLTIIEKSISSLKEKLNNLELSCTFSKDDINQMFSAIRSELESRRRELLAAVEEKKKTLALELTKAIDANEAKCSAMKSVLENLTDLRTSNDSIETVQLMSTSSPLLHSLSEQEPIDVSYIRGGVLFSPVYIRKLIEMLKASGVVRLLTYEDTPKPGHVLADENYHAILQDPAEIPPVPQMEVAISRDPVIICPSLEWDSATACKDVTVVGGKMSNVQPDPPVPDSGCRMTSYGRALTTTPCPIGQTDRVLVAGKGDLTVKTLEEENVMLFEVALTPLPVSSCWTQQSGVSVRVVTCTTHKGQLCLWVKYDGKLISDTPVTHYKVGTTLPLNIGILLDSTKCAASVINMNDRCHVVSTIPDVSFARPMWGLMYVGLPDYSDISWELISGNSLSRDTVKFLSSLC